MAWTTWTSVITAYSIIDKLTLTELRNNTDYCDDTTGCGSYNSSVLDPYTNTAVYSANKASQESSEQSGMHFTN